MLKEFKAFALRGNVIDLAIGVIIGVAFGKIVTSLVNDIIMPPIGLALGGLDFSDLFIDLSGTGPASLVAARDAGLPVIAYGAFINTVLDFAIVALAIFFVVRQINRLVAPPPAVAPSVPPPPPRAEVLLEEIRNLLAGRPPG